MCKSRFLGHVGERAVAVVAIQNILSQVGKKKIVEAVVVVVGDCRRRSPSSAAQAGLIGDVGEGAVTVVLVQTISGFIRALDAHAAQKEDIQPAVVVVV